MDARCTVDDVAQAVLITGGAGFIGSHLTEAMLATGASVTVLDDFSTGSPANLATVHDHPRLTVVDGSVLDPALVQKLVAEHSTVVHLAAAVGVQLIMNRPLDSFLLNIQGTHHVLEAAEREGASVVIASTSEVFGRNTDVPLHEASDRVLGPPSVTRWWYSLSKSVDEVLAHGFHEERGLHTTVVRFFNTVGPRQVGRYGMVVPRFVGQAMRGEPLTVYGDGEQTRTFCHVADTVDALGRVVGLRLPGGLSFNIGGTREISVRELAELVIEVTGSTSTLEFRPYDEVFPEGFEDLDRRLPDITPIRAATGWEPTRSLETIIRDVQQYQRAAA